MINFHNLLAQAKNKKVLLKVLSSSFLALPVTLIVSFISFRKIDPYFMGIWATMTIFETYANVLRLGVVNGMNRELPFALGSGKEKDAISYAQTTFAFNLFSTLLLWMIVPFIVLKFEFNATYLACISVALIRVTMTYYTTYLTGTFRTTDNFNKLSNIQFIMIALHLGLSPLIFIYGFYGYLAMQLILAVVNTLLLHHFRPFHIKPKFNKNDFIFLFKTGFPLFITSYLVSLIDTLPRLFIVKYGNETLMGLYAPVLMVIHAFAILPSSLGTYYYPKMSYLFGKNHDAMQLWRKITKIYLVSFLFLLPVIVVGYFVMDDFIQYFPKYRQSLPYLQVGLFVGPFVMAKLGNLVNTVLKKVNYMGIYVIQYAFFQLLFLVVFYTFITDDILLCAVWTQVLTSICMFVSNFILNYSVVKNYALNA